MGTEGCLGVWVGVGVTASLYSRGSPSDSSDSVKLSNGPIAAASPSGTSFKFL